MRYVVIKLKEKTIFQWIIAVLILLITERMLQVQLECDTLLDIQSYWDEVLNCLTNEIFIVFILPLSVIAINVEKKDSKYLMWSFQLRIGSKKKYVCCEVLYVFICAMVISLFIPVIHAVVSILSQSTFKDKYSAFFFKYNEAPLYLILMMQCTLMMLRIAVLELFSKAIGQVIRNETFGLGLGFAMLTIFDSTYEFISVFDIKWRPLSNSIVIPNETIAGTFFTWGKSVGYWMVIASILTGVFYILHKKGWRQLEPKCE